MQNTADKIIWRVGQIAALAFLALVVPLHPYPGSCLLKALPVTALAVVLIRNVRGRPGYLLFAGLLLSVVGDVALDLDRERLFVVGLGAFLVAHLLYISAFLHSARFTTRRLPAALAVLAYGLVVGWFLREVPEGKLIPVMAYLAAITAMVISAVCVNPVSPLLIVGAAVFMLSDSVIAINKFLHPIPHSLVLNIGLYFLAQYVLVAGFLRLHRKKI
jgi:uncharacterized membrane protein YhhN